MTSPRKTAAPPAPATLPLIRLPRAARKEWDRLCAVKQELAAMRALDKERKTLLDSLLEQMGDHKLARLDDGRLLIRIKQVRDYPARGPQHVEWEELREEAAE